LLEAQLLELSRNAEFGMGNIHILCVEGDWKEIGRRYKGAI
jgi:hypothetical protein